MPVSEEPVDYYQRYKNLKRKFKFLIYEELKKAQRRLLKISRDKSFLLDRLLQYESIDSSSSDSDATESSDSEIEQKHEISAPKKKKIVASGSGDPNAAVGGSEMFSSTPGAKGDGVVKKKKPARKANPTKTNTATAPTQAAVHADASAVIREDGHMTSEEIERHLEAKQALRDLLPEKAPLTVPVELFSTELSGLDRFTLGELNFEDCSKFMSKGPSSVKPQMLHASNIFHRSGDLMEAHSGESARTSIEAAVEDGGLVIDIPE